MGGARVVIVRGLLGPLSRKRQFGGALLGGCVKLGLGDD